MQDAAERIYGMIRLPFYCMNVLYLTGVFNCLSQAGFVKQWHHHPLYCPFRLESSDSLLFKRTILHIITVVPYSKYSY